MSLRAGVSGVLLGALAGLGLATWWHHHRLQEPARATGEVVADTRTVVAAVRSLARLESVAFHMEQIIDLRQRQTRLFGLIEADDALLLVAAGDVIGGVDLAKLRDSDVEVEPGTRRISLRLPAPEVLSVRLDNERTYVYAREVDVWAKRVDDLETRARRRAEQAIGEAALEAGVLARARTNAEATLRALLHSLGHEVVDITWRSGASELPTPVP